MKVTVKPFLFLRKALGFNELEVDLDNNATVLELLRKLREQYGLTEELSTASGTLVLFDDDNLIGLMVLVDGRNIKQLDGTATVLHESAVITLFPPAAGG
ncbi:MAG TPA: MoaD/ThiS family protein [Candidatus Limnocylindrales bacterium]|nr:MoaD/ThiS family protein [Candidatus Limnocylindrales bacterium]